MNDDVREKFDALEHRVSELEAQVIDLENGQIPAVQAQTVDDAPEPTMYEGRLSELRRERDQAQLDLADVRGNYGRLVLERDSLSSQLSDALRKNQDQAIRMRDLEVRNAGLRASNGDVNRQLGELSSKYQKVRQDLGDRNMELAREVDRLRGVVATDSVRQDQVRQINDLLAERVDLKRELDQINQTLGTVRRERNEYANKLARIRVALDR